MPGGSVSRRDQHALPAILLALTVLVGGCGAPARTGSDARASASQSPHIERCDRSVSGAAGVPTAADEPLFIVCSLSFWNQTTTYVPWAVVYQDGSVAVTRPPGKPEQHPSDPLSHFLGGTFSACALAELVEEYEVLARADFGNPQYYDAGEAIIAMTGRSVPGVASSFRVVAYEVDDSGLLTAAQNQARRAVQKWVGRMSKVIDGVVLPVDGMAVVDTADSFGQPARRPAVRWTAPAPIKGACLALTGTEMDSAMTAVRASARQLPPGAVGSDVFTGTFSVRGQERQFNVMAFPPALTC